MRDHYRNVFLVEASVPTLVADPWMSIEMSTTADR